MQVRYQLRHSPELPAIKYITGSESDVFFVPVFPSGAKQLLYFSTDAAQCKIKLQQWNSGGAEQFQGAAPHLRS